MVRWEWNDSSLPDQNEDNIEIISPTPSVIRLRAYCYHRVKTLRLSRVGLANLYGIGVESFPVLRTLLCSFNNITDIDPLIGHDRLEMLDLEGNLISDKSNLMILGSLCSLRDLDISGNPVADEAELQDESWLSRELPLLRYLNGEWIHARPVSTVSTMESSRPATARELEELSFVLDRSRRPSSARPEAESQAEGRQQKSLKKSDSFCGNPIFWARKDPSSTIERVGTLSTQISKPTIKELKGPVKVFPSLKVRS
jgi:hypothetical protein